MYGIMNVTKDVNDVLISYITREYDNLVKFAEKQIKKHSNGATPLPYDLVNEMYMSFMDNMEDRDGVDTEKDACNVVHRYIVESAKGSKYREGCEKMCGNLERTSWVLTNEDGQERTVADTVVAEKSYTAELFDYNSADVDMALTFMDDTFEEGADRVEGTVKTLVRLAEELHIIEAEKTPESKVKAEKIIAAVKSMAFKEASDDFKEAFRVLFAQALA